jgi:xylan 1,4-beta-xylosidase
VRFTPFDGGFGPMNLEGIRKASYFAYRFLRQLGTEDTASDDPQSWITGLRIAPSRHFCGTTRRSFHPHLKLIRPSKKEQPAVAKGTLQLQFDHPRDGN